MVENNDKTFYPCSRNSWTNTMFRLQKDTTYMMPAHFGGYPFDTSYQAQQRATMLAMTFETERAELERYIRKNSNSWRPKCRLPSTS